MKVLVVGELNADLIFSGFNALPRPGREALADGFSLDLGGSSAICAAGLARLGTPVAILSKVGDDMLGRYCLERLRQAGVDTALVQTDPQLKTGITASFSSHDRALTTFAGAMTALTVADISTSVLGGFTHLHVSSYYLQSGLREGLPALFRMARELGMTVSLDPGYDPAERWSHAILEVLPHCDVFLLNELELAALSAQDDLESGLRFLRRGEGLVVAKLGKLGCAAWSGRQLLRAAALEVSAVDTTGAGDCFNAGFLHAWLRGAGVDECLEWGTVCGGLSTLALGGCNGQPRSAEIVRILRDRPLYETIRNSSLI